jgi:hypothetical protein
MPPKKRKARGSGSGSGSGGGGARGGVDPSSQKSQDRDARMERRDEVRSQPSQDSQPAGTGENFVSPYDRATRRSYAVQEGRATGKFPQTRRFPQRATQDPIDDTKGAARKRPRQSGTFQGGAGAAAAFGSGRGAGSASGAAGAARDRKGKSAVADAVLHAAEDLQQAAEAAGFEGDAAVEALALPVLDPAAAAAITDALNNGDLKAGEAAQAVHEAFVRSTDPGKDEVLADAEEQVAHMQEARDVIHTVFVDEGRGSAQIAFPDIGLLVALGESTRVAIKFGKKTGRPLWTHGIKLATKAEMDAMDQGSRDACLITVHVVSKGHPDGIRVLMDNCSRNADGSERMDPGRVSLILGSIARRAVGKKESPAYARERRLQAVTNTLPLSMMRTPRDRNQATASASAWW